MKNKVTFIGFLFPVSRCRGGMVVGVGVGEGGGEGSGKTKYWKGAIR